MTYCNLLVTEDNKPVWMIAEEQEETKVSASATYRKLKTLAQFYTDDCSSPVTMLSLQRIDRTGQYRLTSLPCE